MWHNAAGPIDQPQCRQTRHCLPPSDNRQKRTRDAADLAAGRQFLPASDNRRESRPASRKDFDRGRAASYMPRDQCAGIRLHTLRLKVPTMSACATLTAPPCSRPTAASSRCAVRGREHDGRLIRIRSAKCTIGSAPGCTLRLVAAGVAPLHLWVLRGKEGTIVRRLHGAVTLNGGEFAESALSPGDRLRLGTVGLEVVACNQPAPPRPRCSPCRPPIGPAAVRADGRYGEDQAPGRRIAAGLAVFDHRRRSGRPAADGPGQRPPASSTKRAAS